MNENPDNGNGKTKTDEVNAEEKKEQAPPPANGGRPFIILGVTETGEVGASGCLDNLVIAFGILLCGVFAIYGHHQNVKKMFKQGKTPGGIITSLRQWKGFGKKHGV